MLNQRCAQSVAGHVPAVYAWLAEARAKKGMDAREDGAPPSYDAAGVSAGMTFAG
jgi:hypothetical protein